jgi:O-acetyl-ADP-ribose deacetylase (regulator of RNase III)
MNTNTLRFIQFPDISAADRQSASASDVNRIRDEREILNDNCIRFPYALTESDLRTLSTIYPRQIVTMARQLRISQHPIASCMLWKANTDLYGEAIGPNGNQRFLDIGGSWSHIFQKNKHTCNLITSAREQYRALSTLNSTFRSIDYKKADPATIATNRCAQLSAFGMKDFQPTFDAGYCTYGTQNCKNKATFAIAVHSIYDITPMQMYETFDIHGLNTLVAALYLPNEIIYGEHYTRARMLQDHLNFYVCYAEDDDYVMHFNDSSFAYIHKKANWEFWAKNVAIKGPAFTIVIETQYQFGIEYRLRMTRVNNNVPINLYRHIMPDVLSEFVMFPNVVDYFVGHCVKREVSHHLVPAAFHQKCLMQALKPAVLDNNTIITYIHGITQRIDINTTEVNKRIPIEANELYDYAISVCLYAAYKRADTTEMLKHLYDHIKNTKGYLNPFTAFVSNIKTELVKIFVPNRVSNQNRFSSYDEYRFTSYRYSQVYTIEGQSATQLPSEEEVVYDAPELRFKTYDLTDRAEEKKAPRNETIVLYIEREVPATVYTTVPKDKSFKQDIIKLLNYRDVNLQIVSDLAAIEKYPIRSVFDLTNLCHLPQKELIELFSFIPGRVYLYCAVKSNSFFTDYCHYCKSSNPKLNHIDWQKHFTEDHYKYMDVKAELLAQAIVEEASAPIEETMGVTLSRSEETNIEKLSVQIPPLIIVKTPPIVDAIQTTDNSNAAPIVTKLDATVKQTSAALNPDVVILLNEMVEKVVSGVPDVCFYCKNEIFIACQKCDRNCCETHSSCCLVKDSTEPKELSLSTDLGSSDPKLLESTGGKPNKEIEYIDNYKGLNSSHRLNIITSASQSKAEVLINSTNREFNGASGIDAYIHKTYNIDRDQLLQFVKSQMDIKLHSTLFTHHKGMTPAHILHVVTEYCNPSESVKNTTDMCNTIADQIFTSGIKSICLPLIGCGIFNYDFKTLYERVLGWSTFISVDLIIYNKADRDLLNSVRSDQIQICSKNKIDYPMNTNNHTNLPIPITIGAVEQLPLPIVRDPTDAEFAELATSDYLSCCQGVTQHKLREIMGDVRPGLTACDYGAGPGNFSVILRQMKFKTIIGYEHVSVPIAKQLRDNYDEIVDFDYDRKYTNTYFRNVDFHILDIGPNASANYMDFLVRLVDNTSGVVIIKFYNPLKASGDFSNEMTILMLINMARQHKFIKPTCSKPYNTEFYLALVGREKHHRYNAQYVYNSLWAQECKRRQFILNFYKIKTALAEKFTSKAEKAVIVPKEFTTTDDEMREFYQYACLCPQRELQAEYIREKNKMLLKGRSVNVNFCTGVFGSGKTKFYLSTKDAYVITPTVKLRDDVIRKGMKSDTPHTALSRLLHGKFLNIIVDECFMFRPGYIAFIAAMQPRARILLCGDPLQIDELDMQHIFTKSRKLTDVYDKIDVVTTMRSTADVCMYEQNLGYPAIKTNRGNRVSVTWLPSADDLALKIIRVLQFPVICFNELTGAKFSDATTVHTTQGQTLPHLVLYVDNYALTTQMTRSFKHVRVALQRHTDNLIIVGDVSGMMHTCYHENSKLQTNNAIFDIHRTTTTVHLEKGRPREESS